MEKLVLGSIKFVLMVLATISIAFAISFLWGWFVVPLGLPAIGALHAYGLLLAIGMFNVSGLAHLMARIEVSPEREEIIGFGVPIMLILVSWFGVVIGYIVQLFM